VWIKERKSYQKPRDGAFVFLRHTRRLLSGMYRDYPHAKGLINKVLFSKGFREADGLENQYLSVVLYLNKLNGGM
jgi:hypothetical protein